MISIHGTPEFQAEMVSEKGIMFLLRKEVGQLLHVKQRGYEWLPVRSQEEVDLCQKVAMAAFDEGLPAIGWMIVRAVVERIDRTGPKVVKVKTPEPPPIPKCSQCGRPYERRI